MTTVERHLHGVAASCAQRQLGDAALALELADHRPLGLHYLLMHYDIPRVMSGRGGW